MKKRGQNKINMFIFYAECIITYVKLQKVERKTKLFMIYFLGTNVSQV